VNLVTIRTTLQPRILLACAYKALRACVGSEGWAAAITPLVRVGAYGHSPNDAQTVDNSWGIHAQLKCDSTPNMDIEQLQRCLSREFEGKGAAGGLGPRNDRIEDSDLISVGGPGLVLLMTTDLGREKERRAAGAPLAKLFSLLISPELEDAALNAALAESARLLLEAAFKQKNRMRIGSWVLQVVCDTPNPIRFPDPT
jgi:hypothetical protein